jgi:3-phosphoshikimate 1-carboxyvinyltransferase
MHERPIADLVDALREVGARIRYLERDGFPPLEIEAVAVRSAREFSVRGDASSQFLTGLLQAAPLLSARNDVVVRVSGALISRPYVDLTLDMMRSFGVLVRGAAHDAAPEFVVPRGSRYQSPRRFAIEGDASSASYFLALGALAGGPVRVTGLGRASRQADVEFAAILERMGVTISSGPDWIEATSPGVAQGFRLRAIDADFNHMPDAAMTVALLAVFGDSDSVLRNIGSWRVKETDRLAAMSAELAKLGARVETGPDWLRVAPPAALRAASIETYDDHRIAMTFALAACAGLTLRINDPRCVAKTYPDYFEELARLARPVGVAA